MRTYRNEIAGGVIGSKKKPIKRMNGGVKKRLKMKIIKRVGKVTKRKSISTKRGTKRKEDNSREMRD